MPERHILEIAQSDVPVICVDTCTVLDLMRDPTRSNVQPHERQAALDVLTAAENESRIAVLMADQVRLEFATRIDKVEKEAKHAVAKLISQVAQVEAIASVYGGVGSVELSHLNDHATRARKIVERWAEAASPANQSPEIPSRALIRLNKAQAPASKGKDSFKDCVVIETYLDIAHQLRTNGHVAPIVFASSNVKDYAAGSGSVLRPVLREEFAVLNMEYAPNMGAAKHHLRV